MEAVNIISELESKCPNLLLDFHENIYERNFTKIKKDLIDASNRKNCPSWDLISAVLSLIGNAENLADKELVQFSTETIDLLSKSLSQKEFLLLLLSKLEELPDINRLVFALPFLESCMLSIDLTNTKQLAPVFHIICDIYNERGDTNKPHIDALVRIADLLHAVFHGQTFKPCYLDYLLPILIFFTGPLHFLDTSSEYEYIFKYFLEAVHICSGGIFSSCSKLCRRIIASCNDETSLVQLWSASSSAWLHIMTICIEKPNYRHYWPSVLSLALQLQWLANLTAVFIKYESNLLRGDLNYFQIRYLVNIQSRLINQFSRVSTYLPTSWWNSLSRSLIPMFETIATFPIKSENLPKETENSVKIIDCFLSASTITARCELFDEIFKRSPSIHHCGLRGHMILAFKNFLHDIWSMALVIGSKEIVERENVLGEKFVCLPYQSHYLRRISDLIFQYPVYDWQDSIFDQSGWIMTALNILIYVQFRNQALTNTQLTEQSKEITHTIVQSLYREKKLHSNFLDTLVTELNSVLNRYELAEREHLTRPDPKTIAPGAPSLKECEFTLIRLRLLQNTISRVTAFGSI